jgi:hypothetical protein
MIPPPLTNVSRETLRGLKIWSSFSPWNVCEYSCISQCLVQFRRFARIAKKTTDAISPDPERLPVVGEVCARVCACQCSTLGKDDVHLAERVHVVRVAKSALAVRIGASGQNSAVFCRKDSMLEAGGYVVHHGLLNADVDFGRGGGQMQTRSVVLRVAVEVDA